MTKKHFKAIAEILRDTREKFPSALPALGYLETELATYLRTENPLFDTRRFLRACKGEK